MRCFFGFHKWSRWVSTIVTTTYVKDKKTFKSEGQKRECEICGKKQLRTL